MEFKKFKLSQLATQCTLEKQIQLGGTTINLQFDMRNPTK